MSSDARIAPIETHYRGHRFRSRLEARWAIFLDALGVEWEYEKEGYVVDGVPYLPDFWLPSVVPECREKGWGHWLEIKPLPLNEREIWLLDGLAKLTGHAAFAFVGQPKPGACESWYFHHYHGGKPVASPLTRRPFSERWTEYEFEGKAYRVYEGVVAGPFYSSTVIHNHSVRLSEAFDRAMSARFEHGERPR